MSMLSALTNHWAVAGSGHHGSRNNDTDASFKVPTWNHSVIKGKHLFLKEKAASTGRQITKAVPEKSTNAIHLRMKKKWWDKNMNANANMRNIQSQEDFDAQLQKAGDKLTVVHFFSPSCGACKALHYKVCQLAVCIQDCNFLWSTMMNRKRFVVGSMSVYCHFSDFIEVRKVVSLASAAPFQLFTSSKMRSRGMGSRQMDLDQKRGPEKDLEESELQSLVPPTNIPNAAADASHNINGDVATVAPSND